MLSEYASRSETTILDSTDAKVQDVWLFDLREHS
jgi:hypothetical protein